MRRPRASERSWRVASKPRFEMKEAITSLECRLVDVFNAKETISSLERQLMEALRTIETLKAEVKALK